VPSPAAAIDARGVSKVFRGDGSADLKALDDVSVTIRENEFFTLLGPSGCGKTTLLRLIAGFEFPTEGTIRLYDQDIALLPPYLRPVNTVFQSYALFPHMTVGQNIGFGLEMQDKPKREVAARVDEMLRLVRMEDLKDRLTSQISGGQQQRVALARALAPQPKVLLLDEPLSALDLKLRKEMQGELKRLQTETGITFVFVTHDQEEALTMSDRIAVMSKGRILQVGTPRDIYDHPEQRFVADFIGEANLMTGEIAATTADVAQVRLVSGAAISATLPAEARPTGKVTVMVRPEHAEIVASTASATLTGTLESTVYFGTDTHFNVRLADGTAFVVRRQNDRKEGRQLDPGTPVGVLLAERAAQVLRD
jgi:spermidine/putrescine transport system ATP-binding protein